MAQFFISYSKKDGSELAELVVTKLARDAGLAAWLDIYDIKKGKEWKPFIDNAIETTICMLVIVTPASLQSSYVSYEWARANALKKEVIPLVFDTDIYSEYSNHPLFALQAQEFSAEDDEEAWDDLLKQLKEIKNKKTVDPAVAEAERILNSPEKDKWDNAFSFLETFEHRSAFEALARLVNSHSPEISAGAGVILGRKSKRKGEIDKRCLLGYERVLVAWNDKYYREVLRELVVLNDPSAIDCLMSGLDKWGASNHQSGFILSHLAQITHPEIIPVLISLTVEYGIQRSEIIAALGNLKAQKAVPILISFLPTLQQGAFRRVYIKALGQIGHPDAINPLVEILYSYSQLHYQEDFKDYELIVEALGSLENGVALDVLEQIKTDRRFSNVQRRYVNEAIKQARANLSTSTNN